MSYLPLWQLVKICVLVQRGLAAKVRKKKKKIKTCGKHKNCKPRRVFRKPKNFPAITDCALRISGS